MPGDLTLQPFVEVDFDALTELWHETNRSAYPYVAVHQQHTLEDARAFFRASVLATGGVWVASLGSTPVGLIAVASPYITQLAVATDHRRQGIGSKLLRHVLASIEGPWRLFTFRRNAAARKFYEKHGFRAIRFGISPPPESEPDVEFCCSVGGHDSGIGTAVTTSDGVRTAAVPGPRRAAICCWHCGNLAVSVRAVTSPEGERETRR